MNKGHFGITQHVLNVLNTGHAIFLFRSSLSAYNEYHWNLCEKFLNLIFPTKFRTLFHGNSDVMAVLSPSKTIKVHYFPIPSFQPSLAGTFYLRELDGGP